jgi:hypothetical protein
MTGDPFWVCYDHDDDCRRAIGSPLNIWVGYRLNEVKWLSGIPKSYSKTKGVTRTFCGDCGTSIGYSDAGLRDELYLTIGFFNNPERLAPQAHAYWRMKLPWIAFSDDLPRLDEYSRTRDDSFGNPNNR